MYTNPYRRPHPHPHSHPSRYQRLDAVASQTLVWLCWLCAVSVGHVGCATPEPAVIVEPTSNVPCEQRFDDITAQTDRPARQIAAQIVALSSSCGDELEAKLRAHLQSWHNRGMSGGQLELLAAARSLYQLYLERFPLTPEADTVRYFHGELLWQLAMNERDPEQARALWIEAGQLFGEVVERGGLAPEIAKESAQASVLAWKNAIRGAAVPSANGQTNGQTNGQPDVQPDVLPNVLPDIAADVSANGLGRRADRDLEPRDIPATPRGLIAAYRRYARYIDDPKDPELVTMVFIEARTYWQYNHFAKAVPLLEELVRDHRDHDSAEPALGLLLDILNVQEQPERMAYWLELVLADPAWSRAKPDSMAHLVRLHVSVLRKRAEDQERAADHRGCARSYRELHDKYAKHLERGDQVLFRAGVCADKAGDIVGAVQAFERLDADYPESALRATAAARRKAWSRRKPHQRVP